MASEKKCNRERVWKGKSNEEIPNMYQVRRIGVPYGLLRRRTEPGYVLEDGTVLLESERDEAGRYRGGAGMDGMYLSTSRLYTPITGDDGQIMAFQEVRP